MSITPHTVSRLALLTCVVSLLGTTGCLMSTGKPDPGPQKEQGTASASLPGDNSGGCIETSSTPKDDILLTAGETVAVDVIEFEGDDPDCVPTSVTIKPALPSGLSLHLSDNVVQLLGQSTSSRESSSYEVTATTDGNTSFKATVKIKISPRTAARN